MISSQFQRISLKMFTFRLKEGREIAGADAESHGHRGRGYSRGPRQGGRGRG
jgi:hypothetical protein